MAEEEEVLAYNSAITVFCGGVIKIDLKEMFGLACIYVFASCLLLSGTMSL